MTESTRLLTATEAAKRLRISAQILRAYADKGIVPVDPTPDGDPDEILYVDERTGYPVSRREHHDRRELVRHRSGASPSGYVAFRRGE